MNRRSRYVFTKSLSEIARDEAPRGRSVLESIQAELPVRLDNWTTDYVKARSRFIVEKFLVALGVDELMSATAES